MSERIKEITEKEFQAEVLEKENVVVDFYSTECPPCEALARKYENTAELFGKDVNFIKIFRQGNRALAEKLEVNSSPTVLFYKNGVLQKDRFTGAIKQSQLEQGLVNLVGTERGAQLLSNREEKSTQTDVIVLGGGPAGLTAGIYLSQAKLRAIIIDPALPGGYVATTHEVSNYPGFAAPQQGFMLSHYMSEQAKNAGCEFRAAAELVQVDLEGKKVVLADGETIIAKFIIIASGSSPKILGVPGEVEYRGQGISYCATCDAKYYQDKEVVVIGGGNSAVEESLFIAKFAKKITLVHQFAALTANREAQEKLSALPNIEFLFEHEPRQFVKNNGSMDVEVENLKSGKRSFLKPNGVFVFAGFQPNTELFHGLLEVDQWGYIKTGEDMKTNIEGIYAAGDIRSKRYRQITTAVADATIAAIEITNQCS
ncbi:MAG: FAD-dependent oxidoreductase [Spirochaetales bacterium]|nr:FAD-dependent oxidoreductase [Spirochaetales bacterium]